MDVYVDGSYNKHTGYYGWAYIGLLDNKIVFRSSGSNNKANEMWQVAGELCAVINAIRDTYKAGTKIVDIN